MSSFNTIAAFVIIILVIGFADVLSQKTKSYISVLFSSTIIFISLFLLGLNKNLFEMVSLGKNSGLGVIAISLLITHLGTTLNFKTVTLQWKTVVLSFAVQIGIVVFMLLLVPLFFDKLFALVSIPAASGGLVAVLITQAALGAKNLGSLAVFAVLLLSLKCVIGYPFASFLLKREGRRLLKNFDTNNSNIVAVTLNPEKAAFPFKPFKSFSEKYTSFEILLAKTAVVAFISFGISRLTSFEINPYILCFVFGYLAKELAFLESDVLKKANSFGFLMLINIAVIFSVLTIADLDSINTLWLPLLVILMIALFSMTVVSLLVGRLLGFSPYMSMAAGIACMFGFPGTYVIPGEVAKSISKSKEEHDYVFNNIFPVMLIAGFVNVTILSVIIAGIIVKFI